MAEGTADLAVRTSDHIYGIFFPGRRGHGNRYAVVVSIHELDAAKCVGGGVKFFNLSSTLSIYAA